MTLTEFAPTGAFIVVTLSLLLFVYNTFFRTELSGEERMQTALSVYGTATPIKVPKNCVPHIDSIERYELELAGYFTANNSEHAIVFCSGLGLDHSDFENQYNHYTDYDAYFISLFGFEKGKKDLHHQVSFDDLVEIYCSALTELKPKTGGEYNSITLVGFSISADVILQACATNKLDVLEGKITKIILLDPNVDKSTLFISSFMSNFSDEHLTVDALLELNTSVELGSVKSWANLNEYLVKIIRKFEGERINYLGRIAKDVCEYYRSFTYENFCELALKSDLFSQKTHIVFSNDLPEETYELIRNSTEKSLGKIEQRIRDGHFDLISDSTTVLEHIKVTT